MIATVRLLPGPEQRYRQCVSPPSQRRLRVSAVLPTDDNGAVDEAGAGIEVVDEIEDIPVGESQDLTVSLDAGKYVLICNIFEETEQESHYQMGMRTAFTVE